MRVTLLRHLDDYELLHLVDTMPAPSDVEIELATRLRAKLKELEEARLDALEEELEIDN